jgi:hypothetical protein
VAVFFALSEDASFYVVASYRLRHGGLPLSWVALLAQPAWAPAIVLLGLTILLFPDGQLPAPRLRWVLWPYLGVAALRVYSAAQSQRPVICGGAQLVRFDPHRGPSNHFSC